MKIVCISDTHEKHELLRDIPECDLLIHAGDITFRGELPALAAFDEWIGRLKSSGTIKEAVIVPGNHDLTLDPERREYDPSAAGLFRNSILLNHKEFIYQGVKIFGSPYSPEFCRWAFSNFNSYQAEERWKAIPDDAAIVVTHGPAHGFLDKTVDGRNVGCRELFKRLVWVKPKLHICGHIHEGYGEQFFEGIHFVNASSVDARYRAVHKPIVIDLDPNL